jgi:hypothetical protein
MLWTVSVLLWLLALFGRLVTGDAGWDGVMLATIGSMIVVHGCDTSHK